MKKLVLFLGVAAVGLLAACSGKGYKIAGASQEAFQKGDTLYLVDYDTDEKLDSVVVADSAFVFEGDAAQNRIVAVKNHGRRLAVFLLEPGDITVDFEKGAAKGTALNDKNYALTVHADSLMKDYYAKVAELQNVQDADSVRQQREALESGLTNALTALNKNTFEENKDNVLGLMYFLDYAYDLDRSQLDTALEGVPDWFKNSVRVGRFMTAAKNKENTEVGKMFTDFTVKQSDGTEFKLSDVVGKGDYVLADFWASWCGPCRREMPGLKDIYGKYNGKGLKIVGIAVWDEPADTHKAVAQMQLPWQIVDNAQRIPTDIYGIMGIPHIIMFAPDGKIAFRGLTGEELKKAVDDTMSAVAK